MDLIERTIRVSWQHRVFFTDDVFNPTNFVLRNVLATESARGSQKVLFIVDKALAAAWPSLLPAITAYFAAHREAGELVTPPLVQPGGETAKQYWSRVFEIHALIDRYHLDRHSTLITAGGGALLDMTGLAAATAHRGIRHIRMPTTTLSQCDSGVGVKNGINAFGKKNFVGTFCPPFAVINDFQLLATLSPRDKRAGYVETVKVACIRDRAFFELLERDAEKLRQFEPNALRRLCRRCAELHVSHIVDSGDPFESGSARPLDFGHWAAHKLEQLSDFTMRHGEAVASGIALDVVYSRRMGYLDPHSAERVLHLLERLGFELFQPQLVEQSPARDGTSRLRVLEGLDEFREHLGGSLAITLLQAVGAGFEVHEMDLNCLVESIEELRARHTAPRANPAAIEA